MHDRKKLGGSRPTPRLTTTPIAPTSLADMLSKEYTTLEDVKQEVEAYLLGQHKSFWTRRSDKARWLLLCRGNGSTTNWKNTTCPFKVNCRIRKEPNGDSYWKIITWIEHDCSDITHNNFRGFASAKHIAQRHAPIILALKDPKVDMIKTQERILFQNSIKYMQAFRAKKLILQDAIGDSTQHIQKLPSMLKLLRGHVQIRSQAQLQDEVAGETTEDEVFDTVDIEDALTRMLDGGDIYAEDMSVEETPDTFACYFIAPKACQLAAQHLRPLISVDGCHTTNAFGFVLLICVGFDLEENILPLAWALVTRETKDTWKWFFGQLKRAYPRLDHQSFAVLSDRQKGLICAIRTQLSSASHYFCIYHIGQNVASEYGRAARNVFIDLAYETNESKFWYYLKRLDKEKPALAKYIRGIPPSTYARWNCLAPTRNGQFTSNVSESINATLIEARQQNVIVQIISIWHNIHDKFYNRQHVTFKHSRFTNACMARYGTETAFAREWIVRGNDDSTFAAGVYRDGPDTGIIKVRLLDRYCQCLEFQEYHLPCRHAIATAQYFNVDPEEYIDEKFWGIEGYRATYAVRDGGDLNNMYFISQDEIAGLASTHDIRPPQVITKKGRTTRSRRKDGRSGHWNGKRKNPRMITCSFCNEKGHTTITCPAQRLPSSQNLIPSQGRLTRVQRLEAATMTTEEKERAAAATKEEKERATAAAKEEKERRAAEVKAVAEAAKAAAKAVADAEKAAAKAIADAKKVAAKAATKAIINAAKAATKAIADAEKATAKAKEKAEREEARAAAKAITDAKKAAVKMKKNAAKNILIARPTTWFGHEVDPEPTDRSDPEATMWSYRPLAYEHNDNLWGQWLDDLEKFDANNDPANITERQRKRQRIMPLTRPIRPLEWPSRPPPVHWGLTAGQEMHDIPSAIMSQQYP